MSNRMIQRAVRKGVGRLIPRLVKRVFKPLLTETGQFDPRLVDLGIDAVRPDDSFIASYPRSGNTWLRFIIASLLTPNEELSFRNIDRFVPDPERAGFDLEELSSPRIIKTHWPYFDLFPKWIYIVRDPRDVFVSFYYYASNNRWFAGDLENFSSFQPIYGDWVEHVDNALISAAQRPNCVLWLKYEDLLDKSLAEVKRVAFFLGLNSSVDDIERALQKNSFSSLKAKEEYYGPERGAAAGFFRKGTSGDWRDRLSRRQIDELTARYYPFLERLGYEIV